MSKLNIDQKTIKDLFSDKRSDFLIPDYQRPYAWGETECQTLWEDLYSFALPDNDCDKFKDEEYFLGPIVTFKNENGKLEIIDGQQRLTTLMLLLRAFYAKFGNMNDKNSLRTKKNIEECIWKTDEFDEPDMDALKIDSEVATDNDKGEFLSILRTGVADKSLKSAYASNYRFFQTKISEFLNSCPTYFPYLPTRILKNCILLPIEAESQDTALRIFSTLNDRGKPLSDADIFKAQFYKYYSNKGEKDAFISRWKALEELCGKTFRSTFNTPMDELFTRYMYFLRAKKGIKLSTTEALRKFYEKDNYEILKNDGTLSNLELLASFWRDVLNQDNERFSEKVLKRLFVLAYAPNSMWSYFVSVYFLQNKDADNSLDNEKFYHFLSRITGFIWAYALTNPGVNALRTPIYAEMINVVNGKEVTFKDFLFEKGKLESIFNNYSFLNQRPITRSMITWWAFQQKEQELLSLETNFDIEHIYARNRQEKEHSLSNASYLEMLGNKSILESRINIRASDYRFEDKKKYYQGYNDKAGTKINEISHLAATVADFDEQSLLNRNKAILNGFIDFLKENDLLS